jgi:glycerol uptake facilitator-like aquaporin
VDAEKDFFRKDVLLHDGSVFGRTCRRYGLSAFNWERIRPGSTIGCASLENFAFRNAFYIGNLYGVVIGFALLTVAFLGGTYNPAVSFGPHLFKVFFNTNTIRYMPFYVVGSLFGGMFAAYGYRYIYSKKK